MAQFNPDSLLKALDEMNQCPICLEPLNQPKFLPCGHSFCFTCLDSYYATNCSSGTIVCSLDRSSHPVPKEGISGLPGDHRSHQLTETLQKHRHEKVTANFPKCSGCKSTTTLANSYCTHCCTAFCDICITKHEKALARHLVLLIDHDNISDLTCREHENQFKVEFCSDCSCLICRLCLMDDHLAHRTSQLSYEEGGDSEVGKLMKKVCSFENEVDARKSEINDYAANTDTAEHQVKQDIDQHIDKLIASLEAKRKTLLSGADSYFKHYRTTQTSQRATLGRAKDQAQSIKAELTKKAQVVPFNPNIVPESLDISDLKQQVEAICLPEVVLPPIQCTFIPQDSLNAGELSMELQKPRVHVASQPEGTSQYQVLSRTGYKEEHQPHNPPVTPKKYGKFEKKCGTSQYQVLSRTGYKEEHQPHNPPVTPKKYGKFEKKCPEHHECAQCHGNMRKWKPYVWRCVECGHWH